jgi:hypothetical protein
MPGMCLSCRGAGRCGATVTTGVDGGDWMEVRTGLAAGDEVVTAGLEALADAMPVRTAREVDVFAGPRDAGVAADGAARPGTGR